MQSIWPVSVQNANAPSPMPKTVRRLGNSDIRATRSAQLAQERQLLQISIEDAVVPRCPEGHVYPLRT